MKPGSKARSDSKVHVKNPRPCRRPWFDPCVGRIPCRREWVPTPVFLPGEFHGQRNLLGYSPWGCKESDTNEWLIVWLSYWLSESGSEVAQSCPTLCDPMDCNLPGSSVHGISQVRILEWVVIPFSKGSSPPRDQTWVPGIASRFFTVWATNKAQGCWRRDFNLLGFNMLHEPWN